MIVVLQVVSLLWSIHTNPRRSRGVTGAFWEQYGSCQPPTYPHTYDFYWRDLVLDKVVLLLLCPAPRLRVAVEYVLGPDLERLPYHDFGFYVYIMELLGCFGPWALWRWIRVGSSSSMHRCVDGGWILLVWLVGQEVA